MAGLFVVALAAGAGCAGDADAPDAVVWDGRSFDGDRFLVDGRAVPPGQGDRYTASFVGGRLYVSGGCNDVFADYEVEGGRARVVPEGAGERTLALCLDANGVPEDDEYEEQLSALLASDPEIVLEGDVLTISGDGRVLTLSAAQRPGGTERTTP